MFCRRRVWATAAKPRPKRTALIVVGGAAKRRLRVDDLLGRFEDMRRRELLDESAASLLALAYV